MSNITHVTALTQLKLQIITALEHAIQKGFTLCTTDFHTYANGNLCCCAMGALMEDTGKPREEYFYNHEQISTVLDMSEDELRAFEIGFCNWRVPIEVYSNRYQKENPELYQFGLELHKRYQPVRNPL